MDALVISGIEERLTDTALPRDVHETDAEAICPEGYLAFGDTHIGAEPERESEPAAVQFDAFVRLSGGKLGAGMFGFGLFGADGVLVAKVRNGEGRASRETVAISSALALPLPKPGIVRQARDGKPCGDTPPSDSVMRSRDNPYGVIPLPALKFSKPGIYKFTLKRIAEADTHTRGVESVEAVVTVAEDEGGNLAAYVSFADGYPEFRINAAGSSQLRLGAKPYKPVQVFVCARIQVRPGFCSCASSYAFGLFDHWGQWVSEAVASCDCVKFKPVNLYRPGVFEFDIREVAQTPNGPIIGPTSRHVTIAVTDDGDGCLAAEVKYTDGCATFIKHCMPKTNGFMGWYNNTYY